MPLERWDTALPPDSAFWTVCREQALLLGGPAAAVLQIADPEVAQGVARYSDFERDAWGRLVRTLEAVWTIGFGPRVEAEALKERLIAGHARFRIQRADTGEAGSGLDPDLQLWVLATLIMGSLEGYVRIHGAAPDALKASFYRDMRLFGSYFGLDPAYGPPDWPAFASWYAERLRDSRLGSDPASRRIAWGVARPPRPLWLRWAMRPFRYLLAEGLPTPVNERLGFPSTGWSRWQMATTDRLVRWLVPWLPAVFRYPAPYRRAVKRHGWRVTRKGIAPAKARFNTVV
ncbi:MAG: oxygenase MpaB family protein [Opitutales bacterium]